MHEDFKRVVAALYTNWDWKKVKNDYLIKRLIFTDYASYRKDMKVSQMVGRVKFKFKHCVWGNNDPQNNHRFCISVREKPRDSRGPRAVWIARDDGWCGFQPMMGSTKLAYIGVDEVFKDPLKITDEEIGFVEAIYPEILNLLPLMEEGFDKLEGKLRDRFY